MTIVTIYRWKWSFVTFLNAVATVDDLTAGNYDVKLADTRIVLKSSPFFEKINKHDREYVYCPLEYLVTLLLSSNPKARADGGHRE